MKQKGGREEGERGDKDEMRGKGEEESGDKRKR